MTRSPSPCAWTPDFPGCSGRAGWGGAGKGVGGRGLSGEERQEQREGQEPGAARPGARGAGEAAGHFRVGVAPGGIEPLLQTPPTAPALRARPEGAAPDPLTQAWESPFLTSSASSSGAWPGFSRRTGEGKARGVLPGPHSAVSAGTVMLSATVRAAHPCQPLEGMLLSMGSI